VASREFLFPVELLSNQFRNFFCFEISQLWADGKLNTNDDALDVQAMLTEALSKDWEVYIQSPVLATSSSAGFFDGNFVNLWLMFLDKIYGLRL
jgi:hypothetical protein